MDSLHKFLTQVFIFNKIVQIMAKHMLLIASWSWIDGFEFVSLYIGLYFFSDDIFID